MCGVTSTLARQGRLKQGRVRSGAAHFVSSGRALARAQLRPHLSEYLGDAQLLSSSWAVETDPRVASSIGASSAAEHPQAGKKSASAQDVPSQIAGSCCQCPVKMRERCSSESLGQLRPDLREASAGPFCSGSQWPMYRLSRCRRNRPASGTRSRDTLHDQCVG